MTHEKNMIDYMKYVASEMPIIPEREGFTEMEVQFLICNEKSIFLDSPPKLGDFVPINEKGEVMEKPKSLLFEGNALEPKKYVDSKEWLPYEKALDRILWVGWEVTACGCYHKESKTNIHFYPEGIKLILSIKVPEDSITKAHEKAKWIDGIETYNKLITSGVKLERIEKK